MTSANTPFGACRQALMWLGVVMAAARPAHGQDVRFPDPSTFEPVASMLERSSPDLTARRAVLAAVQARLGATGFWAPLTIAGEIEEVAGGAFGNAGSARVEVSREFAPGLAGARRAVVQADVEGALLDLDLARRLLLARAAQHFARAVGATAVAHRLAAEDSLLAATEDALHSRFALGAARYVDVLRIRTERLRVQSELAAAQTESRAGRNRLVALVAPPDTGQTAAVAILDSLISARSADPDGLALPPAPSLDALLASSGAGRRASLMIARARARGRLVRVARRPLFNATLGAQRFEGDGGVFRLGPTVGASLTLPFTAGRVSSRATIAAERHLLAAQASGRAALARSRADAGAARDRYETARLRLALYDAALLRGARDERESALAAYRTGDISLLDLLDFERALARTEIDRVRSRIDAGDALADLVAELTGEPSDFETDTGLEDIQ